MTVSDEHWSKLFLELLGQHTGADAAHDPCHIQRVVTNAQRLSAAEGADWLIVMPAAWLHDCVIVPKSSPDRKRASTLAARRAVEWLESHAWPHGRLDEIAHAIESHSFSAGIEPRTLEAKVVQDADRLDALGAVGLARTLMLGGELKRAFYDIFWNNSVPRRGGVILPHRKTDSHHGARACLNPYGSCTGRSVKS